MGGESHGCDAQVVQACTDSHNRLEDRGSLEVEETSERGHTLALGTSAVSPKDLEQSSSGKWYLFPRCVLC